MRIIIINILRSGEQIGHESIGSKASSLMHIIVGSFFLFCLIETILNSVFFSSFVFAAVRYFDCMSDGWKKRTAHNWPTNETLLCSVYFFSFFFFLCTSSSRRNTMSPGIKVWQKVSLFSIIKMHQIVVFSSTFSLCKLHRCTEEIECGCRKDDEGACKRRLY